MGDVSTARLSANPAPPTLRPPVSWWTILAVAVVLVASPNARAEETLRVRRFVQSVSQDPFGGAGGAEADTQVQPPIAVAPNHPSVAVPGFQEGRLDSGGGCAATRLPPPPPSGPPRA